MPAPDQPGLARHRNWVVAAVLVVVVVVAGALASSPARGPRPKLAFGAQVPSSAAALKITNGWTAAAGKRRIAVYAGSQRVNPRNGLLIVARTDSGRSHLRSFVLRGTGAVTLLKPAAPRSENDAYGLTLRFVTANGATGSLDLGHDREALNH